MKKISIVTNEDLTNIRNKIGYYFEGGTGFISRKLGLNGSTAYLKNYDYITLASKIETSSVDDKHELEDYIENRIIEFNNNIQSLQDQIKSKKTHIKSLENYLNDIRRLDTFEETFNYLSK